MTSSPEAMRGRRVLVTGATSGIGLALVRRLSADGARLAILARGAENLEAVAAELPGEVHPYPVDVTDADELPRTVARAVAELGGLDVVVAGAGIANFGPFTEMAPDDWRRTIATTLVGMMATGHAVLPELERTGGILILIGSVSGRLPTPWLSAYAAAKHGIRGFARSLDAELRAAGSPVRAVVIAPGPVDTPIWRHSRTTDRREPPPVFGTYRTEAVVDEILRAISRPARAERTVGGAMALAAFADGAVPNLSVRVLGALARVAWRRRERRPVSATDTQSGPARGRRVTGGFLSRPSLLDRVRSLRER